MGARDAVGVGLGGGRVGGLGNGAALEQPTGFATAVWVFDALDMSARLEAAGWQPGRYFITRSLYEMAMTPYKKGEDGEARFDEMLRQITWEWPDGITHDHDFVLYLPVKGRASKYIDIRLCVYPDGIVIAVKGERAAQPTDPDYV